MATNIALDTNVLLYLYDANDHTKRRVSEGIVASNPIISTQVISEFINVTKRALKLPKQEILYKCNLVFDRCQIISVDQEILDHSYYLLKKYDFQIFDSIIISSTLAAGCNTLYSEDLQHNQLVEGKLTIINPFLNLQ
ncbi:PIN domain-containing protein [Dyadobacter jiangsuensis]|uniref:Putative nucleic acid-binding protein n=1 Tax=Dyadobacter jiangsuensis TaxID=1591085 RepID=A0A2P8G446_9BACT|nr:PIN domain-containing protein [Dyadobacter jiangsuensis]PSL28749.1 putative nucleic acid-binding protein [Dyadobacter jiangsuensis]